MQATIATLVSLVALAGPQAESQRNAAPGKVAKISHCVVTLIDDVAVPARESGVVTRLDAKLGSMVKIDQVLGTIDDSDAMLRKEAATNELKVSQAQADSNSSVDAAIATTGVAKAEFEKTKEINDFLTNAVSPFELRRLELTFQRAGYQADIAKMEKDVAGYTASVRAAQLAAVDNEIRRRLVESPLDGVVVKRLVNVGEWVTAGDPIYQVVRMNKLRVEGLLSATRFLPHDVIGQPCIIEIRPREDHPPVQIESRISFASPVVDSSGQFLVYTEFDNAMKDGFWIIRPGLSGEMTITLKTR